jgi:hypothetical protein
MRYLACLIGFCWMTFLFAIAWFPITVPVLLAFPWLMWGRKARQLTTAIPWSVWRPTLAIAAMFLWGIPFALRVPGPWHGYQWPALVCVGLFAGASVLAWREWQRANRDRRVAGLMLLQLWFGAIGTYVVAVSVSAGGSP